MESSGATRRRRVLITRPEGDAADASRALLESAGYEVYSQPLLDVEGIAELPAPQRGFLRELDSYRHVIFISTNAVKYGMACVAEFWPQFPEGLDWYAVGAATAAALAAFGIVAATPGAADMTSEGLLALPGLQDVDGARVLIVKGEGGREALQRELVRRGARVDELACYRRGPPRVAAGELAGNLSRWGIEVALVTSGESLANLQLLLTPAETSKLKHMALIVPSERVARQAQEAGFDQVVTASNASDTAMLYALQQWSHGTGG
jgi:uroporphyrinogen-III synthase